MKTTAYTSSCGARIPYWAAAKYPPVVTTKNEKHMCASQQQQHINAMDGQIATNVTMMLSCLFLSDACHADNVCLYASLVQAACCCRAPRTTGQGPQQPLRAPQGPLLQGHLHSSAPCTPPGEQPPGAGAGAVQRPCPAGAPTAEHRGGRWPVPAAAPWCSAG